MTRALHFPVGILLFGLVTLTSSCQKAASPPAPSPSSPKQVGYALWLDGQDDCLRTGRWFSGDSPKGACLEAWVKPVPTHPVWSTGVIFVHAAVGYDKSLRYLWDRNAFVLGVIQPQTPGFTAHSGRKVTTDGWHHVAAVFDTGRLLLYADGALVAQTSATVPIDWQTDFLGAFIGGNPLAMGGARANFRGQIDEVRIWKVARSTEEIAANMHRSIPRDAPGLEAYWNFDEGNGTVAKDLTGHGHDAQFGSKPDQSAEYPTWLRSDCPIDGLDKPALAGHSLWFSGRGEQVQSGPLPALRSAASVMVEAWVRPASPQVRGGLFVLEGSPNDRDLRVGVLEDGRMTLGIGKDGSKNATSAQPALQPNAWQHVVVAYNGDEASVGVDGKEVVKLSAGKPAQPGLPLKLGVGVAGASFSGELDELRVWNVARTDREIRDTLHCTIAPNTPGLVGYWRFDEGGGKITRDLSPSRAHAQLGDAAYGNMGDPLWLVSGAPITVSAPEEPKRPVQNYALEFDGTDDSVDMGNAPELRLSTAVTVEAWIKPSTVPGEHPVLGKGNANGNQNAYELRLTSQTICFMVSDGSAGCCGAQGWWPALGKTKLEPNVWHHVAGVDDGKQVAVYLDGVLTGSIGFDRLIADVPFTVKVGTNSLFRPRFFAGQIDEVRLWNRARTQTDILTNMNVSLRGDEPGLVGYWTFDDPSETGVTSPPCPVAFDHSGHNNHGILGDSMTPSTKDPRWVVSTAPIAPPLEAK